MEKKYKDNDAVTKTRRALERIVNNEKKNESSMNCKDPNYKKYDYLNHNGQKSKASNDGNIPTEPTDCPL